MLVLLPGRRSAGRGTRGGTLSEPDRPGGPSGEETLGERLRRLRLEHKWPQTHLALRSGVPQPHIARIETGWTRDPKTSTLEALADALGVSGDALRGRKPLEADRADRADLHLLRTLIHREEAVPARQRRGSGRRKEGTPKSRTAKLGHRLDEPAAVAS